MYNITNIIPDQGLCVHHGQGVHGEGHHGDGVEDPSRTHVQPRQTSAPSFSQVRWIDRSALLSSSLILSWKLSLNRFTVPGTTNIALYGLFHFFHFSLMLTC